MPDARVTCECRRMGGGFGGKESQAAQWAALAALAARVTGHPAKCRLDRDDDMIMTGKRHDFRIDWQAGFDRTGRLSAVDARCLRAAAIRSTSRSVSTIARCSMPITPISIPTSLIRSRRLRTNTVSNTAFRGFGGPQGMMLAERMMDAIACSLGLDLLDVKKAKFYGRNRNRTPYGMKVEDNIIASIVEELERTSDYRSRRAEVAAFNRRNAILKKGLALTPVKFGISFTLTQMNQAGALVHVPVDGQCYYHVYGATAADPHVVRSTGRIGGFEGPAGEWIALHADPQPKGRSGLFGDGCDGMPNWSTCSGSWLLRERGGDGTRSFFIPAANWRLCGHD